MAAPRPSPLRRTFFLLPPLLLGAGPVRAPAGCTDSRAANYDGSATTDNGGCSYACAAIGAQVWADTARAAAAPAGTNFSNATCVVATVIEANVQGSTPCCGDCCAQCCGAPLDVPEGSRYVVQGTPRAQHVQVVANSSDRAVLPPEGAARLAQLGPWNSLGQPLSNGRTIKAEARSFLAVRYITAKDTTSTAARPSFITGVSGCIVVEQSHFEANAGRSSGVITMSGPGGEVHVRHSYFRANSKQTSAPAAGVITLPDGGVVTAEWSVFYGNEGNVGGAIYSGPGPGSVISITGCLFKANEAASPGRGGGLSLHGGSTSSVVVRQSDFEGNFADELTGVGGAIWQDGGTLAISGCSFSFYSNTERKGIGELLAVNELVSWSVSQTVFAPEHGFTACGAGALDDCSVYTAGSPPAGCAEHPCQPGQSCRYQKMSTWCTPCVWPAVSRNGISCVLCPAGKGPAANLTSCEECLNGTFSSHGMCGTCGAGSVPAANKSTCVACATDMVSVEGLMCESCAPGWQANPAQSACEYCGSFGPASFSPDGSPCSNCTAGRAPNSTRTECIDCPAGFYSPDGAFCETCSPGQEPSLILAASSCQPCNSSSYSCDGTSCILCFSGSQPRSTVHGNNTDCEPCPSGTAGVHGICQACPAGKQPAPDRQDCLQCSLAFAPNTYSPDGVACMPCLAGSQPNMQRSNCDACAAGQYSATGLCTTCGPGYQPTIPIGATNCTSCAFVGEGYHSHDGTLCSPSCAPGKEPSANRASCVDCASYAPFLYSPNGTRCIRCFPGYEVDASGSHCTPCGAGNFSTNGTLCETCALYGLATYSLNASAACQLCRPGSAPNAARSGCIPCETNIHSTDGTPCITCPPGHEASSSLQCHVCNSSAYSIGNGSGCELCANGHKPTASGGSCEICPPGTAGVRGSCVRCVAGKQPDTPRHQCVDCGPGSFGSNGIACSQCPAGRFVHNGQPQSQCAICQPGTYSQVGASDCATCEFGLKPNVIAFDEGATHCVTCTTADTGSAGGLCDTCPAGKQPNASETGCDVCPPGRYSTSGISCAFCQPGFEPNGNGGATGCNICVGTHSNGTSCDVCPAGKQANALLAASNCYPCSAISDNMYTSGGSQCVQCSPGSQVNADRTNCSPCQVAQGFHSPNGTLCTLCSAGTEPSAMGTTCVSCMSRGASFISVDGTSCSSCEPGSQPTSDRSGCIPCSALGTGIASVAGEQCLPCNQGRAPSGDRSNCTQCAVGQYSGNGVACEFCDAGYQPNSEQAQCIPCHNSASNMSTGFVCHGCSAGHYTADGGTTCLQCPEGSASSDGNSCVSCRPGRAPDHIRATCIPCDSGRISVHGVECAACPAGQQPDLPLAAAFCRVCSSLGATHFSSNGSACQRCQPGFQPDDNATRCVSCASIGIGLFSTGAQCTSCPPGSEPDTARAQCVPCPGIDQVSSNGQSCIPCPDGRLANDQKTSCMPCAADEFIQDSATGICGEQYGSSNVPLAGGAACDTCSNSTSASMLCRTCGVGFTLSAHGCSMCEAGSFSAGGVSCLACPPGTRANNVRSSCDPCGPDKYFDGAELECSTCGIGQQISSDGVACEACPVGLFSDDQGKCRSCPPGAEPNTASTACTQCPNNFVSAGAEKCSECPDGFSSSRERAECRPNQGVNSVIAAALFAAAFVAGTLTSCATGWCRNVSTGTSTTRGSAAASRSTAPTPPLPSPRAREQRMAPGQLSGDGGDGVHHATTPRRGADAQEVAVKPVVLI